MKFVELKSSLINIKQCYYIYGKDAFLRNTAQKLIENACVKSFPDFNIARFDDENFNDNKITEACQSVPLGDDYRVVVIKNVNFDKSFLNAIENIFVNSKNKLCVIIVKEDLNNANKSIIDIAEKVDCNYLDEDMLIRIVAKNIQDFGAKIEKNVLKTLILYCGGNLTKINLEQNKLCSYVGKNGTITKEVVDLLVNKDIEYSIFELSNAVSNKNSVVAFNVLKYMLDNNEAPQVMFGLLMSNFRRMFFANTSSLTNSELSKLLDVKEYSIKVARNNRFSPIKLKKILELGAELDLKIRKGEITDENAIYTLIANSLLI